PISGYGNLSVYRYATGMYRDIENEGPSRYFTADDVSGLYAVVDPTSAHGMQNLNAGNVQAHYSGDTLGYNGERLDVEADVDFGAGTINIVVNGGCDQCGSNTNSVYTVSTTEGNVIRGGVGFVVDANLEGSGYSTASFSATDVENNEVQSVSITGSGSGTFGGPGAQVLIGVNDINKTVVNGEGSYSGNYTDVFVADKVVAPN
ncbi:MAG: hypothetical protein OEX83_05595, partial [Gammaproteobacteria bacterium]|nr:hypothetical protein [Gammaproteobacteria bacterium]